MNFQKLSYRNFQCLFSTAETLIITCLSKEVSSGWNKTNLKSNSSYTFTFSSPSMSWLNLTVGTSQSSSQINDFSIPPRCKIILYL